MIEARDINDQDILNNTRQDRADNGCVRFKYTMPDGSPFQSEWISPDNAKKAIGLWCDAVRNQLVEVGKAIAREKGRPAREAQAKARREELDKIVDEGVPASDLVHRGPMPQTRLQDEACRTPEVVAKDDPVVHAKNQVALLEAEERHWLAESERATKHLATARDKLRKWKQIVASFEAGE